MRNQLDVSAQTERLYFWLRVSREKFNLAMDQDREFAELKKILVEIKKLETDLQEHLKKASAIEY